MMKSQTNGMVEFLQKLLISKDKEIAIGQDEVLDSVVGLSDEITITDGVSSIDGAVGKPYKWEPTAGVSKWNFATWG